MLQRIQGFVKRTSFQNYKLALTTLQFSTMASAGSGPIVQESSSPLAASLPSRKAVNQSFWITSRPERCEPFPALGKEDNISCDVCVIGGGITGISVAAKLMKEGMNVVVLEARDVGGGTTGYSTSKLSVQHNITYSTLTKQLGLEAAAQYAEMNIYGRSLIKSFMDEYGIECDWQTRSHGLFTFDESKVAAIRAEYEAAVAAGIPDIAYSTDVAELPASIGVKAAFICNNEAQFNAYAYVAGLAAAIHGPTCRIFENTRVVDVTRGDPHSVLTAGGAKVECKYVVMASHIPILDRSLHFSFCYPSRTFCIAVKLFDRPVPQQMYINVDKPDRSLRSAGMHGDVLVVAGEECAQGEGDPLKAYDNLQKWTEEHFGRHELVTRWSAMDYFPADKRAYIGYLSRAEKTIFTATGFKKWGLAMGSAASSIICDLIQNRANPWTTLFDATRWELSHSVPGVAAETAHTVKHLVGDKVAHMVQHRKIEELGPGEGGIVYHKGTKVAAYRSPAGEMFACQAQCSHLGCDLIFNTADITFECPCHGSRFEVGGKVIHGPAVKDLTKYALDW